jgi:hypothetical protein
MRTNNRVTLRLKDSWVAGGGSRTVFVRKPSGMNMAVDAVTSKSVFARKFPLTGKNTGNFSH